MIKRVQAVDNLPDGNIRVTTSDKVDTEVFTKGLLRLIQAIAVAATCKRFVTAHLHLPGIHTLYVYLCAPSVPK